ncbi:hypothetical protein K2173_023262 [Erythroxylum novogranatense]|uniref:Uncharacterized protein n=1 Tax=Erythroxylum novogranatense TaxID=1862640 RepID=A0AAV8T8E1_9ROSI|nr:hypothetical protein K2173_023262 [Erythroxylum novogranatense]
MPILPFMFSQPNCRLSCFFSTQLPPHSRFLYILQIIRSVAAKDPLACDNGSVATTDYHLNHCTGQFGWGQHVLHDATIPKAKSIGGALL